MKTPELSIIMPVFNREEYVEEAITSLLSQTYSDFELIIIDDASTDNSLQIISSFSDPRVRIFKNAQNHGIVFSRNKGLQMARGKYIAPFDSDDISMPDKFRKQIDFLEANPDFGMVGCWVKLIDDKSELLKKKWILKSKPESIPAKLMFRNFFAQPAVVMCREAIPKGGYVEGYNIGEDYRMWVDIVKNHKAYNLPEYLVKCRVHDENITKGDSLESRQYEYLIYRYIFSQLKIVVDDQILTNILAIKSDSPIRKYGQLVDIKNLLILILKQNESLKVYNQKQLIKVVFNRWIKVCSKSRYLHFRMLYMFFTSELLITRIRKNQSN